MERQEVHPTVCPRLAKLKTLQMSADPTEQSDLLLHDDWRYKNVGQYC